MPIIYVIYFYINYYTCMSLKNISNMSLTLFSAYIAKGFHITLKLLENIFIYRHNKDNHFQYEYQVFRPKDLSQKRLIMKL